MFLPMPLLDFLKRAYRWIRGVLRIADERIHGKQSDAFGQLFGGAVQQADVGVGALDDLAVQFKHEAQHAVRGRVLRAEVQGVVLDLSHQCSPP